MRRPAVVASLSIALGIALAITSASSPALASSADVAATHAPPR